jgi:hypothetical protein
MVFVSVAAVALCARGASGVDTSALDAERDALIDKITRGQDVDESVKRFAALVQKRDQIVATSQAAKEREKAARERERAERESLQALREQYKKTADYEVGWRCALSMDPAHPAGAYDNGRYVGDWGKIVRKERVKLAPKTDLDEPEPATLYEVAGIKGRYFFRGEKGGFGDRRKGDDFVGEPGDLALVCFSDPRGWNGWGRDDEAQRLKDDDERKMPEPWRTRRIGKLFVVRLAHPPLIVRKGRWNPLHISHNKIWWAIHDVKWKLPTEQPLLINLEVARDLGNGRYEIDEDQGLSWVLEVPPTLAHRDLLLPGHALWAIMGQPRFDRALKKLVLTAEDLEARYIVEKQAQP